MVRLFGALPVALLVLCEHCLFILSVALALWIYLAYTHFNFELIGGSSIASMAAINPHLACLSLARIREAHLWPKGWCAGCSLRLFSQNLAERKIFRQVVRNLHVARLASPNNRSYAARLCDQS
jgi:hypothetical protein